MIDSKKKHRIQLTDGQLWQLRNLLAQKYHQDRRNIRWTKQQIAHGGSDIQSYPLVLRQKHLKETKKLLRKLSRRLDIKWFVQ